MVWSCSMGTRSEVQKSGIGQSGGRLSDDSINRPHLKGDLAQMVEKIQNLESDISRQKGEFGLFGLILREGSENRWDVVAAAHWFGEERTNDTQYLSEKLKEVLGGDELLKISRVVTMGMKDAFVEEVRRMVSADHGL